MAEAVLEIVLGSLSELIRKEISLFLGFDQEFNRLASLLTTIKATLEDAEEKQFSDSEIGRDVKDWLLKLKDAAYTLDDIMDECATEALEMEYKASKCGLSHKSSFLSSFHPKHIAFRYKLAKKMKRIGVWLDDIAAEKNKFHLTEIVRERSGVVPDWRQTTSIVTQPLVYGRNEDKDKIVDFLVGDASEQEDLSVYPIVGLGGLGKTTLAQLVFNHDKIVNHFELKIWVCVSEDFTLKRMTKAIIEGATKKSCEDLDLELLQRKLQDLLRRKRYLLVLDDVWNDKQENWQRLKSVLACGGKGASILVTTRLPKVAKIMGTIPHHELSRLSDEDCWELFKQRAFGPNEVQQKELVIVGKEIIKKCGGFPLAAIALGSLLRFKREEKEWLYVKESKLWNLQGEAYVMPALRLSYLHLPVKLRQCFSFCALFPKDEIISKQLLIDLWTANGFISSNQMLEADDIGNEVWNELYWRSFFENTENVGFGQITIFKMHDLVHDLAGSVTQDVCCITDDNSMRTMSEETRHLLIYNRNSFAEANSIQLHHVKSLKTYMEFNFDVYEAGQLSPQVLNCYSLRVLLSHRLNNLSSSIGRLKYLRYLDISEGRFKNLPNSLCKLCNLEVLKLDGCVSLQKLPGGLTRLKRLQNLSLRDCDSLTSLPRQIGKLTSLNTLSKYIVGEERGFLLEELGQLNLKGQLHIKNLERLKSVTDAKKANMSRKKLNQLWLSWERNEVSQLQENVEQILEALQPYAQKLYSFGVGGYTGAYFPQWISIPSLNDLKSLELVDCKSCLNLPELWKLPSLKYLKLSNMIHVIYLFHESYDGEGLMALKTLFLEKLPNLIGLSREERVMFPRLKALEITECPNLLGLPCLPSLSDLYIQGKYNQQLPSSIHKLGSLESLHFSDNEELIYFPDGILRNLASPLKTLGFHRHSKLKMLPTEMIHIHALQQLYINDCRNIEELPNEVMQRLHSLKELDIVGCDKLKLSSDFQYLTCLETLAIGSCSEVEGFHEALQHMTTLKSLTLSDLPNLEYLPECIGNLTLLHEINIYSCPKLACLPTSIQQISGLEILSIHDCSKLEKRCQKEIGEDWPKIVHVQYIEIENDNLIHGGHGGSYFEADTGFLWHSL
ncbi:putative P-loop containing nucleoside triphosphate hydrolase, leucine-rich repeat domain, L [Medicago truncatula]|uniref:Putative P-loop containing nucleoside triphosphate hydrolase, leucine-rich repeat domain, L n=1 Tax=Medicago truncatula TaxID=3880 RepID=A0A396HPH6_MEDTR|nr:putative P-loop containing nucleoside triphosphate hydrolase, leucine-rich repeat domain, L [Medicago truncatula]